MKLSLALSALVVLTGQSSAQECSVPGKLRCFPVADGSTPTLDGDLADWASIEGLASQIHSVYGTTYDGGDVAYKCQYDSEKIYFALDIPGEYRFDELENKRCAAIGTMFKMGVDAAFINMGGCPDTLLGCANGVPDTCDSYRVDLGAHWELRTTQQGVLYPMNTTTGTGDDAIANNDDEYGVSAFCRFDDDDTPLAANEWEGAWSHSNPVEGEMGSYRFEIARLLTTASNVTDKQLAAGETYEFGIAFWDPFETQEEGWSEAGHFLTGCAAQWIDLTLVTTDTPADTEEPMAGCTAPGELICNYITDTPVLDGDLADWADIEGIASQIQSIYGKTYDGGDVSYKCQYDNEKIYFAFDIPGEYRFDETESERCASIATMFKIGDKAAYINMGGCPDALLGCGDSVPEFCEDYRVDLGAHWELSSTQQGVLYPMNPNTGTGEDPIAEINDEYGVSAVCRFEDNDSPLAGNEWEGAWSHTNPVEGEMGSYRFEIARLLTTPSSVTDRQLAPGDTYEFGIAYWDPFETEDGWSDPGHFLTGCAAKWMNLTLAIPEGGLPTEGSSSAATMTALFSFVAALVMATAFGIVV